MITVCIGGAWDTSRILKWFERSNPDVSKGPYVVLGEAICLTSICSQGRVDYAGFLHQGVLRISSLSQINGHCSDYLSYDFAPLPELAPGPTRSTQDEREEGEGQDYDDHEAAAIGPAAIDAALPLIPELALGLLAHCLSNAKRAAMSA